MKILFNLHALFQALIIIPIIFVITLLVPSNFLENWVPYGEAEESVLFLFASVLASLLDTKGIKGKIFHIPIWVLLIFFSIFIFKVDNNYFKIFVYSFATLIFIIHTYFSRKKIRQEWTSRKETLNNLKDDFNKINKEQFWKYLSIIYFKPSLLYLYINPIWKIIYDNAIDRNEFIDYYKFIINSIDLDDFNNYSDNQNFFFKNHIKTLKNDLNNSDNFVSYKHRPFSIYRLGLAIDSKNKTFANNV